MPVYLSIGNHERYIGLDKVVPLLEEAGVRVLRNNSVLADGLQLIGIDDADDVHQVGRELANITLDPRCFKVLLYHRPLGWDAAVQANIDLTLSGHTHNGQIFPFNWLVKQQFKLITGLHRSGQCQLYVSPGTGTWGPVMRLGSRNEITCIDLVASRL
jgi:predicted MPP superfamily phosphohydrolase